MSADAATKNKGAFTAGINDRYTFTLAELPDITEDLFYSTGIGPVVEGKNIQIAFIRKPRGSGSQKHSHPNEQWNYVLKGQLRVHVAGVETIAGPGTLIYFPANAIHSTVSLPEEDVLFIQIKDMSHGMLGTPADREKKTPFYIQK